MGPPWSFPLCSLKRELPGHPLPPRAQVLLVPRTGLGQDALGLQRGRAAAARGSDLDRQALPLLTPTPGCWHRWQSLAFAEPWAETGSEAWNPASKPVRGWAPLKGLAAAEGQGEGPGGCGRGLVVLRPAWA